MRVFVALFATLGMALASWGSKEFFQDASASGDLLKLCRDFRYQVSEVLPDGGKHPLLQWLSSRPDTLYDLLTKLMDQPEQLDLVCEMFTVKFLASKNGLNQIRSVVDAMETAESSILDKQEVAKKRVRRDDETEESGSSGSTAEGAQGGQQTNSFLFGRGSNPFSRLLSRGPGRTPFLTPGRPNMFSMLSPLMARSHSPDIPNAFVNPTPPPTTDRSTLQSSYYMLKRYKLAAIAKELWRRYMMARHYGVYKWPFYNPNTASSSTETGTGGCTGSMTGCPPVAPEPGYPAPPLGQTYYNGINPISTQTAPAGMNQPYYLGQPGTGGCTWPMTGCPPDAPQPGYQPPRMDQPYYMGQPDASQVSFQPMGSAPLPPQGPTLAGTPGIMAPTSGGSGPAPSAGTGNPFLTSNSNSIPYEDPFNLASNQNLPAFVSVPTIGNGQGVNSNMIANDPFLFPTNVPSTPSGSDPSTFSISPSQASGTPVDTAADQQAATELAKFTERYGPSFGPLMYIISKGRSASPNTGSSAPAPPSGVGRRKREAVHAQANSRRKRDNDGILGDPSDLLQIASMSSNPQATLQHLNLLQRQHTQNQVSLLHNLLNPGQTGSSSSMSSSSFPGSGFGMMAPTSPTFPSRGLPPFSSNYPGFSMGGSSPPNSGIYGGMRSPSMSSYPSMMPLRSGSGTWGSPTLGGLGGMSSSTDPFARPAMSPYLNTMGTFGGIPFMGK